MRLLTGRVLAVYAFCCAVWGSTWLVIKIGLADLPPFHFAAIRMAVACLLMAPFAFRPGILRPSRTEDLQILFCGTIQIGIAYALIFLAETRIDSSLAAILFCTFPIWMGVLGHFLLADEPFTMRNLVAALLGLAGVTLIEAPAIPAALRAGPGPLLVGGACVLGSSMSGALANVLNKRWFAHVAPERNVWGQTLSGTLFLFLLAVGFERGLPLHWTSRSVFAVSYLAVFGTALAFAGLFWLIPRVPVSVIGTIPLTDTVIAIALGAAVLAERLSARAILGTMLILVGVALTVSRSGE
ncbi:MAG TPA: DMT family transporter, partial [Thermoanaerobaculia bacterium]